LGDQPFFAIAFVRAFLPPPVHYRLTETPFFSHYGSILFFNIRSFFSTIIILFGLLGNLL